MITVLVRIWLAFDQLAFWQVASLQGVCVCVSVCVCVRARLGVCKGIEVCV